MLGLLEWLIDDIVGLLMVGTGDAVLWVLTLGRRRPDWRRHDRLFGAIGDLSFWIGLLVWVGAGYQAGSRLAL